MQRSRVALTEGRTIPPGLCVPVVQEAAWRIPDCHRTYVPVSSLRDLVFKEPKPSAEALG